MIFFNRNTLTTKFLKISLKNQILFVDPNQTLNSYGSHYRTGSISNNDYMHTYIYIRYVLKMDSESNSRQSCGSGSEYLVESGFLKKLRSVFLESGPGSGHRVGSHFF